MNPLQNALAELDRLTNQRAEIDKRIEALQKSVEILEPVYLVPSDEELALMSSAIAEAGMTEAIYKVLESQPQKLLTPMQVRDALVASGFKLPKNNPMASVHTVLKRLATSREQIRQSSNGRETAYFFQAPEMGLLQQAAKGKIHPSLWPASSDPIAAPKTTTSEAVKRFMEAPNKIKNPLGKRYGEK